MRYRQTLINEQAAVSNRVQEVVESGNIKLGQVASDALGLSGRAMLRALAGGETDAERLAGMARGRLKAKEAELRRALEGWLTLAQRFVLGELLQRYEELEAAITRASARVARHWCGRRGRLRTRSRPTLRFSTGGW